MMRYAFLFPGQGCQSVGMGRDFYDAFPVAKSLIEYADHILGFDISSIMFNGPQDKLTETVHSQLALYTHSIAICRVMQDLFPGITPDVVAGLSLGEYTALTASNKVSFEDVLMIINKRGSLMNDACLRSSGSMSAVLGLSYDVIENLIASSGLSSVWIANYNSALQTVITGDKQDLTTISGILKQAGAKRVIPLNVFGAFHSPLMKDAEDGLLSYIADMQIKNSDVQIAMNSSGTLVNDVEDIKKNMYRQITSSVRWFQSVQAMEKHVDCLIEIGCGDVLTSLNKKIAPSKIALNISVVDDLEKLVGMMNA